MISVVRISGHQYVVSKGDTIDVSKLSHDSSNAFETSEVLLTEDNGVVTIGTPCVAGAVVKGTIVEDLKGDKITVRRYRSKSRHRRTIGFRPQLTKLTITAIVPSSPHEKSKREPKQ